MNIIKSIAWLFKSAGTEWNFYPLTNTSYGVNDLTRSDYIKLYTGWQYVAISTIANTIADLDRTLTRSKNDDKVIQHKHFDLITYDLLSRIVSSLQLTWTCYLYKNKIGKTIDSLDFLRTDMVSIVENEDGSLKWYKYNAKNRSITFAKEDVIDISLYSPIQSYPYSVKWVSPMQAVAIQAEMDLTASRWNWNFFKNGASAWDIFTTDKTINEDSKIRFLSRWKSEFQGVNNSHKVALLDNGIQYQKTAIAQKELDFVESRRFTRDEILAIFKVPQAIVGITENSNRASAMVAENTYYKICIKPLATMIQEALNREVFQGIGYFQFMNIIPSDTEALLADLNSWAITINEYRQERWYVQIKDGDYLKNQNIFSTEAPEQVEPIEQEKTVIWEMIQKTFKKYIKWTKENREEREIYGQKKWEAKIQRTDKYEIKYIEKVKELFAEQKNEIVQQILAQKKYKKVTKPSMDNLLTTAKRVLSLSWVYREVFQAEWTQALNDVWLNTIFQVWSPKANKWIRDNIILVAKEVNATTKKKVFDTIERMNDAGKWAEEIAKEIEWQFMEFSKSRASAIARTEITRASSEAEIQAYEQSWVVEWKEWYTALDERTCDECMEMHGKIIGLRETYKDKEETGYIDIVWPSLHPLCRCTLLPVIK